jgi:hypothetical protein
LPRRGSVDELRLQEQLVPGDEQPHPDGVLQGDLIEMRAYVPGDPLKLVLWKHYARTGRMLVRSPERSVAPSRETLVYLVAGEGDEPAAGLARAGLELRSFGSRFLFGADGSPEPTRDAAEAMLKVVGSASHRARGGADLADFLLRGEAKGIMAAILFVPGKPGKWLETIVPSVAARAGRCRVVIGVDGCSAEPVRSKMQRFLFRRGETAGNRPEDIQQVWSALTGAGASVIAIDRATGAPLEVTHGYTN